MSRVNLFYTGGSLYAAYLHPAHIKNGKSGTVRVSGSSCKSYLTLNKSCVIGNMTTGTTDQKKEINAMTEQSH